MAPLIQCDYCPLLFHMDCLEPPLTAMPLGRWMCPNHIEHVVVSTAVSWVGTARAWTQSVGSIVLSALCQSSLQSLRCWFLQTILLTSHYCDLPASAVHLAFSHTALFQLHGQT